MNNYEKADQSLQAALDDLTRLERRASSPEQAETLKAVRNLADAVSFMMTELRNRDLPTTS